MIKSEPVVDLTDASATDMEADGTQHWQTAFPAQCQQPNLVSGAKGDPFNSGSGSGGAQPSQQSGSVPASFVEAVQNLASGAPANLNFEARAALQTLCLQFGLQF